MEPPDEGPHVDAVDGLFQVAAIRDAEDDDLLPRWPKDRPEIAGLDLPEIVAAELLDPAGRPWRNLEQGKVRQNAKRIGLFQSFKVPLGTRGIDQMERHTTSNTAGNNLTISAGGATSGATDKSAGDLILSSGISTGTGTSKIQFQTVPAGSSGTSDNAAGIRLAIQGNNIGINTTSNYGGGLGVIAIANAGTTPSSNATGGGILYAESGALKWRGSSGTTTTLGAAEPHCPVCGADYMLEWDNEKYGYFALCVRCLSEELGRKPWIIQGESRLKKN